MNKNLRSRASWPGNWLWHRDKGHCWPELPLGQSRITIFSSWARWIVYYFNYQRALCVLVEPESVSHWTPCKYKNDPKKIPWSQSLEVIRAHPGVMVMFMIICLLYETVCILIKDLGHFWLCYIRITSKSWDTWIECSLAQFYMALKLLSLGRFEWNKNLDPLIQTLPFTWNRLWKDLEPLNALKFAPTLPLESTTLTQLMKVFFNLNIILV